MNLGVSPSIFINGALSGSACCVWMDGDNHSYVLTASHVVGAAEAFTPVQWLTLDGDVGSGQTVEPSFSWMPLNGGGELDASLLLIRDGGPFARSSDYPQGSPLCPSSELRVGDSVVICGHSRPIFATFGGISPAGEPASAPHTWGPLLRCLYDFDATVPGDSGAAVISLSDGRLVGMHVGEHIAQNGARHAWVIGASDIQQVFASHFLGFTLRP